MKLDVWWNAYGGKFGFLMEKKISFYLVVIVTLKIFLNSIIKK